MKRVVFSGSMRFYDDMQPWATFLRSEGVTVSLPSLITGPEDFEKLNMEEQRKQKLFFIEDHNGLIDNSDVLFIFNPGGYVGNSATLEIGYALAFNKEIYALEHDSELVRDVLYSDYCRTPEQLLEKLR